MQMVKKDSLNLKIFDLFKNLLWHWNFSTGNNWKSHIQLCDNTYGFVLSCGFT